MWILTRVSELRSWSRTEQAHGRRVALVPTLGALHAGHLALVAEARQRADRVVVSIFVNPTQFGPSEDLACYPRDPQGDLACCREVGVDAMFAPDVGEMYPPGSQTVVEVPALAAKLCGRTRPIHFRGVATVVTKLLLAARPQLAVFGEKDFQQLQLVRRLVRDLLLDVEIAAVPIVREPDGVALSSRNRNLDPEARREARVLVRALEAGEREVAAGELGRDALLALVRREIAKAPGAELDYAELCDPESLAEAPPRLAGPALLALAVWLPGREPGTRVRLIDNRVLRPLPAGKERR